MLLFVPKLMAAVVVADVMHIIVSSTCIPSHFIPAVQPGILCFRFSSTVKNFNSLASGSLRD